MFDILLLTGGYEISYLVSFSFLLGLVTYKVSSAPPEAVPHNSLVQNPGREDRFYYNLR